MKDFISKYKISIGACMMMGVLSIGVYFVLGQTKTTVGDNIHTIGNLTVAGNVGIGTTSPNALLQIGDGNNPSTPLTMRLRGPTGTGTLSGIGFSNHGGTHWSSQAIATIRTGSNGLGDLVFLLRNNDTSNDVSISDEKVRITAAGNVGIGTTNPGAKLDVSGDINFNTLKKEIIREDTTARTYTAGTWYTIGGIISNLGDYGEGKSYLVHVAIRYNENHHNWAGATIMGFTGWKAAGDLAEIDVIMDAHVHDAQTISLRASSGKINERQMQIKFPSNLTIEEGGYIRIFMKRIF
jgi:hypothetical protein